MADNNSYEINVTLDDFNGIITKNPNGDGTYNVTYTSLTKDQINEIGQQFAKHLSDTDENGNSKAGLHKVALTGDYTQLENKPSASNLQGFHKAAFSGNTSELNNDKGFLTTATNAYTGSPASTITQKHINEWNNKGTSNFSGNYEELQNKPNIPKIYNYDFLEYDLPELKNLLGRPYVFNTTTAIIDTTNNISLDNFLQTIIQNYEHSSATVQINFFTINHIKFSISYIYTNEGVFTFNFYDKYFTNYLNLKDLNKTSNEILEELNVTGQDQLIWEYDPEQHLLFII